MLIDTRTDSLLVLRHAPDPPAWYDFAPYIGAVLVGGGLLAVGVRLPAHSIAAFVCAAAAAGGLLVLGLWHDWQRAEIRCTFDKTKRTIELKRITWFLRRSRRYALDEFQSLAMKQIVSPTEMDRFAVRVLLRGGGRIVLPEAVSRIQQERAISAIEAFLKAGS